MIKINKKIKITSIFLLASCFMILASSHLINAQEVLRTFTISPPTVQVSLNPGESIEGKLKIVNDGTTSLNFNNSIRDFIVEDDNGTPKILPVDTLSNKYSAASWIGIYPNQIYASPHQKSEVSYFIQVPKDARPGGHYAAVIYTPTTNAGKGNTATTVNTSIGTLFYVTVKGPVVEKATVTKFSTKILWESSPATIYTQILNSSDIHIKPIGVITLKNILGKTSDVAKLNQFNIFPGVSRNYETKIGKGFMLGYYKANLTATYGTNNTPIDATTSFIVFPWKIAVFLILLVIAIIIGTWYWKKKDKKVKDSEKTPEQPQGPIQPPTGV